MPRQFQDLFLLLEEFHICLQQQRQFITCDFSGYFTSSFQTKGSLLLPKVAAQFSSSNKPPSSSSNTPNASPSRSSSMNLNSSMGNNISSGGESSFHVVHTVMEHEWICTSVGWVNGALDQGVQLIYDLVESIFTFFFCLQPHNRKSPAYKTIHSQEHITFVLPWTLPGLTLLEKVCTTLIYPCLCFVETLLRVDEFLAMFLLEWLDAASI